MTSIIKSIRDQLQDEEKGLGEIVDRAFFLASVLKQKQFSAWLKHERDGYPEGAEVPEFRRDLNAKLAFLRPGVVDWVETSVSDEAVQRLSGFVLNASVADIEKELTTIRKKGAQQIPLTDEQKIVLEGLVDLHDRLNLVVPARSHLLLMESVRAALEHWSNELHQAGVVGNGSSFTDEERAAAHRIDERLDQVLKKSRATAEVRVASMKDTNSGILARLFGA